MVEPLFIFHRIFGVAFLCFHRSVRELLLGTRVQACAGAPLAASSDSGTNAGLSCRARSPEHRSLLGLGGLYAHVYLVSICRSSFLSRELRRLQR